MKKFLSVLFIFSLLACLGLATACSVPAHEHTFSQEWSYDQTHHYHECEVKGCKVTDTKLVHNWDNGTITTPATPTQDGVKTFSCTTCTATKTEPVEYTAPSGEQVDDQTWTNALTYCENYTWTLDMTHPVFGAVKQITKVDGNKIAIDKHSFYYFDGNNYYMYNLSIEEVDGSKMETWQKTDADDTSFNSLKCPASMFATLKSSFTFDSQTGEYKLGQIANSTIAGVSITFINSKVTKLSVLQTYGNGIIEQSYTFDYAPVSLTVPQDGVSVPHVCDYNDFWSTTETLHAHTCSACGDAKDVGEHVWDNGVVDGDKIIHTCTVCSATKTEDVANS